MKILILGSDGQLGKSLKQYLKKTNYKCYFFNRDELDINDKTLLNKKFISIKPNIIINTCAYTNVDKAEENFNEANNVNNLSVGMLAKQCLNNDCFLIHISTDYVFDGLSEIPYKENDKKNPLGVNLFKTQFVTSSLEPGCPIPILSLKNLREPILLDISLRPL